jgi:hypothetical protein
VADIVVTDAALASSSHCLREAAAPVAASFAVSQSVIGSGEVTVALDDADAVLERIARALAQAAHDASADAGAVAVALDDVDRRLGGMAGTGAE